MQKNKDEKIRVVYCFDGNFARHACVVVASLLKSKGDEGIHYEVICVCTKDAIWVKDLLNKIISEEDSESQLTFITVNNAYDKAYEIRGITTATYMRFMLPSLLPNVDKVIYMDVDFIVNGSLQELWSIDMKNSYFAGAKADVNIASEWKWVKSRNRYWNLLENWKGKYINAGILVMNLDMIRKDNLVEIWDELAKEKFYYQDQDIINITCQGYKLKYNASSGGVEFCSSIKWLPLKYNAMTFLDSIKLQKFIEEGIYTREEVREAIEEPVGIHYAGEKPWNNLCVNHADMWWKYVCGNDELRKLFRVELDNCLVSVSYSKPNDPVVNANTEDVIKLENRAKRNNANFLLLNDWVKLQQNKKSIGANIKSKGYKRVAIYGMHYIGERLYTELMENGIEVLYGIDKSDWCLDFELKMYRPGEQLPDVDAVIVTPIYWFDSIRENLKNKLSCPIISLKDITDELLEKI